MPRISDCSIRRGRWLLPVAALFASVAAIAPMAALAQRVAPEVPPVRVPGGGTGGGAGLLPPDADHCARLRPSHPLLTLHRPRPSRPLLQHRPKFASAASWSRGAEACKEPIGADGGGRDDECNCARDYCHDDPAGYRVCEKLVNAAIKWVQGPLAVSWQRPYKDDPKPPGGACRGGFYCFDSLNRRLLPQGTFPVGHVPDVN